MNEKQIKKLLKTFGKVEGTKIVKFLLKKDDETTEKVPNPVIETQNKKENENEIEKNKIIELEKKISELEKINNQNEDDTNMAELLKLAATPETKQEEISPDEINKILGDI